MAEGNQYVLGKLKRIGDQIDRRSVYAPALVVLANDQVPSEARDYVSRLMDGEGVFWDLPPLAGESWQIYAGLSGFYGQLVRLLGRDLSLDIWPGWNRSQWVTSDWYPLSRDFGWKVACRALPGIIFRHEQPPMPQAARYLASWPHGYLTEGECREFAPYLHERLVELAVEIGVEWNLEDLAQKLEDPRQLSDEKRFELHNLCAGRTAREVWQFERGLVLLAAMRGALEAERDLISVGY